MRTHKFMVGQTPVCLNRDMFKMDSPPRFFWILLLAGGGFVVGFFGPLIFRPEANQGPLVGILITGPLGLVLGLLGIVLSKLLGLTNTIQWRLLFGTLALLCGTTLFSLLPDPKILGIIYDGKIDQCRASHEAVDQTLSYWNDRVRKVTWAQPRPNWAEQMTETLKSDEGVLLNVKLLRKVYVKVGRKPWNAGKILAAESPHEPEKMFYVSRANCDAYGTQSTLQGYISYDYPDRIKRERPWPPVDLIDFIPASELKPVPESYKNLGGVQ